MKPELLRSFIERKKGVENCIRMLNSPTAAGTIALDFVRLVRTAHSQEEDDDEDSTLSELLEFQNMLLAAFQKRDYEEVEKHIMRVLNLPEEMEDVERTKRGGSQLAAMISHVDVSTVVDPNQFADAFRSHYNGIAAAVLHQTLGRLHREFVSHPGRYYAKYCSIVQSSGTGKSRALIELSTQGAIVVYINLRSKDESGNPFPDRDEIPANILAVNPEDCLEREYSRRCIAFLTALLRQLKLYLLELRQKHHTREGLVAAWSQGMCDMGSDTRSRFFADLDKAYKEIMQGRGVSLEASTAKSNATKQQLAEKEYSAVPITPSSGAELALINPQKRNQKGPNDPPRVYGEMAMNCVFDELIAALPEIFAAPSNSPCLVVAIDEAHPLCERWEPFSPSHILTRVISALSQHNPRVPFWFVFASTASKVADFSAPADLHSASRISIGGKKLFPPYYNFGWDQLALGWKDVEPENASLLTHIARIGRPLWQSLLKSNLPAPSLLTTASQKLCGGTEFEPLVYDQALAVLGQRFLLKVCRGSHDWVEFHQTAVSSHLRVCLGVSEDQTMLDTAYPSEPLLSCAAARLLYPTMDPTPDSFFTTIGKALSQLQEAVVNRSIDSGQQGELVSRIVFLMGKDVAIRALHATPTPEMAPDPSLVSGELLDCKPLPVIRYLTTLFGGNAIKQEHLDLFDGWYINFSHWIGMAENITFPGEEAERVTEAKEWLLCHWKRTSALQCCHGQPSIDKIIPMYKLRRPSERRSSQDPDGDRVSFIVIQDKNRDQCASTFASFNVNPETAGLPRLGHPYITILADLGAGDYELACGFDGRKNVLAVHAFGTSPSTYKFLRGTAAHNIREILEAPHSQDGGDISSEERKLLRQVMFADFIEDC